jgi:hypothetical protein
MSRKPYECYYCRDHGFPDTMVYLAGKDDQGKTIQLEEDGTEHVHKGPGRVSSIENEVTSIKSMINEVKKDTTLFLLVALGSALEEQHREGTISSDVMKEIYGTVKDAALRRGYIS